MLVMSAVFGAALTSVAFADGAAPAKGDSLSALGAALGIGLAVFGGALGQSKVVTAALDGIARNPAAQPKMGTPMILGLALIESLVLLAFVISFVKIQL
ncbi:MAG: ATP synthase F0 subunit C [Bdellovibrionales bacterium]|nr:ATP synthase F0 subunit C [Bdellovibrionales bacterium]